MLGVVLIALMLILGGWRYYAHNLLPDDHLNGR
jgi:hypothetical protein